LRNPEHHEAHGKYALRFQTPLGEMGLRNPYAFFTPIYLGFCRTNSAWWKLAVMFDKKDGRCAHDFLLNFFLRCKKSDSVAGFSHIATYSFSAIPHDGGFWGVKILWNRLLTY